MRKRCCYKKAAVQIRSGHGVSLPLRSGGSPSSEAFYWIQNLADIAAALKQYLSLSPGTYTDFGWFERGKVPSSLRSHWATSVLYSEHPSDYLEKDQWCTPSRSTDFLCYRYRRHWAVAKMCAALCWYWRDRVRSHYRTVWYRGTGFATAEKLAHYLSRWNRQRLNHAYSRRPIS